MATAQPAGERFDDDGRMPRGLTPGALVVMLSPLASPAALQRAVTMANHGLTVLVVDCLPPETADDRRDPQVALSRRIRSLEREREVRRAGEAGVAVVPWRGPGSFDDVLRDLQRHAGPRMTGR